jgi:hypothetical protein
VTGVATGNSDVDEMGLCHGDDDMAFIYFVTVNAVLSSGGEFCFM